MVLAGTNETDLTYVVSFHPAVVAVLWVVPLCAEVGVRFLNLLLRSALHNKGGFWPRTVCAVLAQSPSAGMLQFDHGEEKRRRQKVGLLACRLCPG
jgi:hypothetical protein